MAENDCSKYQNCNDCRLCACGVSNSIKTTPREKSRLVNAQPFKETDTTKSYPWVAYVQTVKRYQIGHRPIGTTAETYGCGGAIISRHTIVTAGHCVCTSKAYEVADKDNNYRLQVTCPKKGLDMNANLNNAILNKINVRVGTTSRLPLITPEYNGNIEAFLYKYDEYGGPFSINGDVGLVVVKNGLDTLKINEYSTICLPTFDQAQNSPPSSIEVKTVGWGKSYDEKDKIDPTNPNGPKITETSCHTNEARTNGDLLTPLPYPERLEFLDCVVYSKSAGSQKRSFCNPQLLKSLDSLSSTIDLPSVSGIPRPSQAAQPDAVGRLISHPDQIECDTYMIRAKMAWARDREDKKVANEDFDTKIDRIVIKDSSEQTIKRICYNLAKVAKYGVCLTEYSGLRNWGFCSRSCDVGDVRIVPDVYEEAKFTLHENIDDSREKYVSRFYEIHVNSIRVLLIF